MAEAYVGEIRLFSFNYAPEGWLLCQGQSVNINQYQALFALIGNVYGGDGQTTFNLPDLRGRVPTQCGVGPLSTYSWGQKGGTTNTVINTSTSFTLTSINQLPAHTHVATFTPTGGGPAAQPTITINVSNDAAVPPAGATPIANGYIAKSVASGANQPAIYSSTANSGTTALNSATATATGGSGGGITGGTVSIGTTGSVSPTPVVVPISIPVPAVLPPFVAMNYAICINGYFPSRP